MSEGARRGCPFCSHSPAAGRCCLGLSAFLTQVTLMREMLAAFSGNELVFGIVLGNWMLLTASAPPWAAAGAAADRRWRVLIAAQVLVAVLPLADVFLLRALRNVVFVRGAEVGVTDTVASCFVLLAPYCLCDRLPAPAGLADPGRRGRSAAGIGRVYFLDNVGTVVGGLLFSFVLVQWLDHFGILYVPALLNLLLAGAAGRRARPAAGVDRGRRVVAAAVAGLAVGVDLDAFSTAAPVSPASRSSIAATRPTAAWS